MFNQNNQNEGLSIDKLQFIIVYDKVAKPAAKSLYNTVSGKYVCTTWSTGTYKHKEDSLTNKNKVLFLDDSLIEENLCSPSIVSSHITDCVYLIQQNNACGLKLDSEKVAVLGDMYKENWGKFIAGLVAAGLIGVGVMSIFMYLSKKKKMRLKLLLDAVASFNGRYIDDFVKGK